MSPSKRDADRNFAEGHGDSDVAFDLHTVNANGYGLPGIKPMQRVAKLTGIQRQPDGTLAFGNFTLSPTGICVTGDATHDEWKALGEFLNRADTSMQWWVGDWINSANSEWGSTYEEAHNLTNMSIQRLTDIAYVCRNVDFSFRNEKLSFTHHQVIASLTPEEQKKWLARAVEGTKGKAWSVAKLRRAIEGTDDDSAQDTHPVQSKTHEKRFRRLWRAVKTGNGRAIRIEDIDDLISWLQQVKVLKNGDGANE
jgi:hypothetical protein